MKLSTTNRALFKPLVCQFISAVAFITQNMDRINNCCFAAIELATDYTDLHELNRKNP
jgi:hypothetical protein